MELTLSEKAMMLSALSRVKDNVEANYRNVSSSGMNNLKKKNKLCLELCDLRNLIRKVEDCVTVK